MTMTNVGGNDVANGGKGEKLRKGKEKQTNESTGVTVTGETTVATANGVIVNDIETKIDTVIKTKTVTDIVIQTEIVIVIVIVTVELRALVLVLILVQRRNLLLLLPSWRQL